MYLYDGCDYVKSSKYRLLYDLYIVVFIMDDFLIFDEEFCF